MNVNFKSFWDESLDQQLLQQQINFFKTEIQAKDNEIFRSEWRKNKGYIPHSILQRTIITKYGRIRYQRRLYKYWDNELNKWQYVFLVDKEFDVLKWQRIHETLKFEILKKVSDGLTHRVINDHFNTAAISNKSISNVINSYDLNLWASPGLYDVKKINLDRCLYINVDETFCSLRVNKKIKKFRVRMAVFYTGLVTLKKRNFLLNKKVYVVLAPGKQSLDTYNFANDMLRFANNFYTNVDNVTKVIGGDGAKWIRTLTEYLPGSIYIADKFHLIRDLRILKSNTKDIINSLAQGNYTIFFQKLKQKYQELDQPTYLQKISFSTLKNNRLGITNQAHNLNIGTFAESNISIIKSLFGFNNKALGLKTFKNMMNLRLAKINGLNILDLLKQEVIYDNLSLKHFYRRSFWNKIKQHYLLNAEIPLASFKDRGYWIRYMLNFNDK
ncbi:MAG: UPF0236 family protein [Spiroplasma sp.]|nr:UPF0236 family protein [Spiroplasma sp.]